MSTMSINEAIGYDVSKLEEDMKALNFNSEKLQKYEQNPVVVAQEQGRDKVEHLVEFILTDDPEVTFDAYFMMTNSLHVFQHEGFWDEIQSNYPDMVTESIQQPIPQEGRTQYSERHHIFPGLGVYLQAQTQFDQESGKEFAIKYTAHRITEGSHVVGKIATAHLMQ